MSELFEKGHFGNKQRLKMWEEQKAIYQLRRHDNSPGEGSNEEINLDSGNVYH